MTIIRHVRTITRPHWLLLCCNHIMIVTRHYCFSLPVQNCCFWNSAGKSKNSVIEAKCYLKTHISQKEDYTIILLKSFWSFRMLDNHDGSTKIWRNTSWHLKTISTEYCCSCTRTPNVEIHSLDAEHMCTYDWHTAVERCEKEGQMVWTCG